MIIIAENKVRLSEWMSWKTVLGLDNMPGFDTRKLQYFNHGSTDSLDVDRYDLVQLRIVDHINLSGLGITCSLKCHLKKSVICSSRA